MNRKLILCLFLMPFVVTVYGQQSDVASKLGYPDLVIYNAKIVTMDDPSFQSTVGTIIQAMAVREDRILATGSNAEIRALAGPQTKQMDLKGRTVLPSFIMTHEHPTDWMWMDPEALKHVLPEDTDFLIHRQLKAVPAEEQFQAFEPTLKEAVSKATSGQWILLNFNWGPDYEYAGEIYSQFSSQISKERVDQLAPNNPVKVKDGFIGGVVNSKGLEELKKIFPSLASMFRGRAVPGDATVRRFESRGSGQSRPVEPDAIFKGRTKLLAELLKAEMELWVAHGITTFASSPYSFHNFQALNLLDTEGKMPGRFAWSYTGPDFHIDTIRHVVGLLGSGSPYLWNVGVWSFSGGSCTTIDAVPEVKVRESCSFGPGSRGRVILEDLIRSGGRIASMHTGGDQDIDFFMDAIEKASREAGFTLEEIRAKRHAFDHASGAPRPDQLPRIKNLGMMVSMINTVLWENHRDYDVSSRVRNYGIEYANWSVPRKSVTEAGIMNGFEIDRPLPHKVFMFIHKGITRYNDQDKRVYGARERTDRIIQLKALTTWGAYYVLRENVLGSLEPDKYADFIVLDQDYLTIPEDDIPSIRVLMTVVGGKTMHLLPSLARESGMEPAGPATWRTKPLENYYAQRPTVER